MEKLKKSAIDLTDLAVGIIVLGIVVSIGGAVLINYRDARLTDVSTYSTVNETANFTINPTNALANGWFQSITQVTNFSDGATIASSEYTVTTDAFGTATLANTTDTYPFAWNVTYSSYNTSQTDYALANDAAVGLGEFGNWFKIIVIVGIAALVLSLIFMSFGNRGQSTGVSY